MTDYQRLLTIKLVSCCILRPFYTYPVSSAESQRHADQRTSRVAVSYPHTLASPRWHHCGWGWPPLLGWPGNPGCHCFGGEWALGTPPKTPSCPPGPLGCKAGRWGEALPGRTKSLRTTASPIETDWTWWLWWRRSPRCSRAGWWTQGCAPLVRARIAPPSARPAFWCGRRAAGGNGGRSPGRTAAKRTAGSWGSSAGWGKKRRTRPKPSGGCGGGTERGWAACHPAAGWGHTDWPTDGSRWLRAAERRGAAWWRSAGGGSREEQSRFLKGDGDREEEPLKTCFTGFCCD